MYYHIWFVTKYRFTPLEIIRLNKDLRKRQRRFLSLTGFTLIEVLIAFSIFLVVMGMVLVSLTTSFRSLQRAEMILGKEQKARICLFRLSKELSSLTKIRYPEIRFKGDERSFFLSLPERTTW
jgi:type II secretory pathway component PulJ